MLYRIFIFSTSYVSISLSHILSNICSNVFIYLLFEIKKISLNKNADDKKILFNNIIKKDGIIIQL